MIVDVNPAPLKDVLAARPNLRLVLLNALRTLRGSTLADLAGAGKIFFEISMLEGVGGVEKLLEVLPPARVLFGSHLPLFVLESAVLKMQESGERPSGPFPWQRSGEVPWVG